MGHRALPLLRRESVDRPWAVAGAGVSESIVEAVGTALPEFDFVGRETVTTPAFRHGDIVAGKLGFEFAHALFKEAAVPDHGTLARSQRAETAAARAHFEVGFGFFATEFGDAARDVDLSLQLDPRKVQRGSRVVFKIGGLATLVAGEEAEAALIDALKEDDARGRLRVSADSGEDHGVGFADAGLEGLLEPFGELLKRVGIEITCVEARLRVFAAEIGERNGNRRAHAAAQACAAIIPVLRA